MKLWATRDTYEDADEDIGEVIHLWADIPCLNRAFEGGIYWTPSRADGARSLVGKLSRYTFRQAYGRLPKLLSPMRITLTGTVTK